MKKLLSAILVLAMLVLCSCNTPLATNFDSKRIDNSYNNYIVGGRMAYLNNNLYICYNVDDYMTLGIYKLNNNGSSPILEDEYKLGDYAFETPSFYPYNDKLYVIDIDRGVLLYDEANDKLADCEYDTIPAYFTDDLKVGWNGGLSICYKDKPEIVVEDAYEYYVSDNKVYYVNSDGWLYCLDVEKSDEPEFLSYLYKSPQNHIHVIEGKVYFDHDKDYNERYQTGLYCYSQNDNTIELVLEGEINCLNSYDDVLYIATDKGIFTEEKQITTRSAKELYLLDEDWIYAIEDDAGHPYRVSFDGENIEKIDFTLGAKDGKRWN